MGALSACELLLDYHFHSLCFHDHFLVILCKYLRILRVKFECNACVIGCRYPGGCRGPQRAICAISPRRAARSMTPAHQPPLVALTTSMDGNIDPATKIDHSHSDDGGPPTVLCVPKRCAAASSHLPSTQTLKPSSDSFEPSLCRETNAHLC